jgi:hypothetical protein
VAILGDRRIHHHLAGREGDAPVEAFALRVDAREDGGSRQQLEGAAHGKTLVEAMAGPLAAERVEDGHAEASGALDFDLVQVAGELRGQAARRARAIRPAAQTVPDQGRARPHCKPAPVDHATSPLRDRTRVVAAGRIVWPLQIITATAPFAA